VKGRKRHLLVDVEGFVLQVLVHSAAVQEREGARQLLEQVRFGTGRMQKVWADSGYWGGPFAKWVEQKQGWKIEIVSRNELVNRRRGTPAGHTRFRAVAAALGG